MSTSILLPPQVTTFTLLPSFQTYKELCFPASFPTFSCVMFFALLGRNWGSNHILKGDWTTVLWLWRPLPSESRGYKQIYTNFE